MPNGVPAFPPVADVLGHGLLIGLGWALAALTVPAVLLADTGHKLRLARTPVADGTAGPLGTGPTALSPTRPQLDHGVAGTDRRRTTC